MSARPDTWMPMYWGDYARDTGHLNAAGHGAYLMLIKHYWCTGESLADDDDELWRVACCDSVKEWQKLRPKIVRLFVVDGGRLRHKRIDAELARALGNMEQRRDAGKASAEARARKRGGGADDNGDGSDNGGGNGRATEIQRPFNARSTPVALPLPTDAQRNVNGRSISVDIPLQRNGRPSPSPSQRKEERDRSLRSLVPSETDSNELFEPDPASPGEPVDVDFDAFWKEYPRKDAKVHARKAWKAARRKTASEAILEGLRCHRFAEDPKFRPLAATWLNGERWADATASPPSQQEQRCLPDVPPSFNPPDAWGVRAWVLRQPDVTMQRGSMPYDEYAINGEIVEDVAIGVLEAAGISPSARPNLDALGAWIRDDCCPLAVLDQIRRQVAHMDGPARSLAAFDTVVRSYVDPITREIAEMDAALARVGVSQ